MDVAQESRHITDDISNLPVGYRLHRVEVLNWRTFHQEVWALEPKGKNVLLTGDIGSGKSTLVDAVTTLLLPAHRIAYNKAAGAESKERTLRTYVLGHYKSERNEESGIARPVALRKPGEYSVILAIFRNEGFNEVTTLAQVFWFKDQQGQPERLYLCANRELSIAEDFSHVGPDMSDLRKRLRNYGDVDSFDTFVAYASAFRRRFGVTNEQSWELFHQTVSMKSVGNLTDFVREHMLERPDVDSRIDDLLQHFEDLNAAHQAVVKAREQVTRLSPLVSDCDEYEKQTVKLQSLKKCREQIKAFFSARKCALLDIQLENLKSEIERLVTRKDRRFEQKVRETLEIQRIQAAITEEGGDRIEQLNIELKLRQAELSKRQQRSHEFALKLAALGLKLPTSEADFEALEEQVAYLRQAIHEEGLSLQGRRDELGLSFQKLLVEHGLLAKEIESLRRRPSNIPSFYIDLRVRLVESLGLAADDIPFAGELLQVRESQLIWEGALERLLRGFATSLLVHDEHYAQVAQWINDTNLRGRLVYLRTMPSWRRQTPDVPLPESASQKLEVKDHARFKLWLQNELRDRFDYACVQSQEEFRRAPRALSITGQIKENSVRHVKDDRNRLDDRSHYVLGWSNAPKIAVLDAQREKLEREMQVIGADRDIVTSAFNAGVAKIELVGSLTGFRGFDEIDCNSCEVGIASIKAEIQELENASDKLSQLRSQLASFESLLQVSEDALTRLVGDIARAEQRIETAESLKGNAQSFIAELVPDVESQIKEVRDSLFDNAELTIESCDPQEHQVRDEFQRRIDAEAKQHERFRDRIVRQMSEFRNQYPSETTDIDASVDAQEEYRKILEQLRFHDLPRFEERFREELRKNAIQRIAVFHAKLDEHAKEISARIVRINDSLTEIEYNRGRYIALVQQLTFNPEVQQFRADLRACIDNSLHGESIDQYAEVKFVQVKHVLDRLRGRQEFASDDRRWRALVTDVRNWFQFSASERWREDDSEHEHYSDSSGKSGGQKEKLAYTILAASLAYQFGLEWVEDRSRAFRFVVIDEAFGRGSDESAEFGLKLFRELNLQLMIVTPLQKMHVIEPHVASVAFVQNRSGRSSSVLNLSIEEHVLRKEAFRL